MFRGASFALAFLAMAIAEVFVEARMRGVPRRNRWLHNLGLAPVFNRAIVPARRDSLQEAA